MFLQIKSFITLIYEVFYLKKVFPFPVCILCGCFLLRPTQWLNQYKVPSRQWKTTRKCSIIKLNYRQALKKMNKYFVTIKLCFFYSYDDWKWLRACMAQWWQRGRLRKALLLNGSRLADWLTGSCLLKNGWELKTRALLLMCLESQWGRASSQCSPDKQLQPGAKEGGGAQTLSKNCSSPLVWKCQGRFTDEKMKRWSPRSSAQVPRDTLQTDK